MSLVVARAARGEERWEEPVRAYYDGRDPHLSQSVCSLALVGQQGRQSDVETDCIGAIRNRNVRNPAMVPGRGSIGPH